MCPIKAELDTLYSETMFGIYGIIIKKDIPINAPKKRRLWYDPRLRHKYMINTGRNNIGMYRKNVANARQVALNIPLFSIIKRIDKSKKPDISCSPGPIIPAIQIV
tara:strand:- start:227 stop:544 length:318 start_codon:yes stop_codon:yes gene_type:complete